MKTGIVLEGGACRGVFTAGVLDVLMEQGITFAYCIGVSAGAGNAMNFKSGQKGRAYALTAGMNGPSYYGLRQVRRSRKLLDLEYLYDTLSYEGPRPFDFSAYYHDPMVCEYVLTCCQTGAAAYFREDVYQKRLLQIVKASCAMPGLCSPYEIDGLRYLDGGIADPMPVHRALSQGCERVVLVNTKPAVNLRPADYTRMRPLLWKLYGKRYPALYEALMSRAQRYFAQLEELLELEREGRLFMIRPERCDIRALEKDRQKMQVYYSHGRQIMDQRLDSLAAYLK